MSVSYFNHQIIDLTERYSLKERLLRYIRVDPTRMETIKYGDMESQSDIICDFLAEQDWKYISKEELSIESKTDIKEFCIYMKENFNLPYIMQHWKQRYKRPCIILSVGDALLKKR